MLSFSKYHGLGNDFLLVDRMEGGSPLGSREVRWLCDRHRGVGADGVLLAWRESGIAGRMQLFNADGSEADTCGNGLRCLAQFLADGGYPVGNEMVLRSGQGLHECTRTGAGRYRVTMGSAEFPHPDVPNERPAHLKVGGETFAATCMVVGNPHAVIRVDDPTSEAQRVGAALEHHPAFPHRANIIFARPRPGGFDAVVHERGVGITEACGSGACALGVAAVANDWAVAGEPFEVHLPGGVLTIEVSPNGEVSQEGPATFVFAGKVALP